jgi:hypothetical protein
MKESIRVILKSYPFEDSLKAQGGPPPLPSDPIPVPCDASSHKDPEVARVSGAISRLTEVEDVVRCGTDTCEMLLLAN